MFIITLFIPGEIKGFRVFIKRFNVAYDDVASRRFVCVGNVTLKTPRSDVESHTLLTPQPSVPFWFVTGYDDVSVTTSRRSLEVDFLVRRVG